MKNSINWDDSDGIDTSSKADSLAINAMELLSYDDPIVYSWTGDTLVIAHTEEDGSINLICCKVVKTATIKP